MKKVSLKSSVTIQLAGGLGNQLFGYAAGRYLSAKLGLPLQVDFSELDRGTTKHGVDIRDFDLEIAHPIDLRRDLSLGTYLNLRSKLALANLTGLRVGTKDWVPYSSNQVGFDVNLNEIVGPCMVRGYFQTWEYAAQGDYVQLLRPRNPTRWFDDRWQEAAESAPLAIHVRRGDYSQASDRYGLLGAEYYRVALQRAQDLNPGRPVWGFSDDLDLAKSLLASHKEIKWVSPPAESNANESLALMANCSGNIVANSTFSWWAAYASPQGQKDVFAPSKWYRGMQDPDRLIPESWQRIESCWLP